MLTCTKIYKDIPFAHRQPSHDGHCAFVHGHNWEIEISFSADILDENNFIIDFGKLKYIKEWIEENLDHSCVINYQDPILKDFKNSKYFKFFLVEDCSCEGLSKLLFEKFSELIAINEKRQVKITKLILREDSKNSAEYFL